LPTISRRRVRMRRKRTKEKEDEKNVLLRKVGPQVRGGRLKEKR